jgi:hypothetical protein
MNLFPAGLFSGFTILFFFLFSARRSRRSILMNVIHFFLIFFLIDFALLACKQLEMYDDDIRRAVGLYHLIDLLRVHEHVDSMRLEWSRLADQEARKRRLMSIATPHIIRRSQLYRLERQSE